jgi:transcriptional regulator with XRE-family HTH domain
MSDKAMNELLLEMFRSEDSPPLTDTVVDSFLALPEQYPEEKIRRMRSRFVECLLVEANPSPVRTLKEKLPFGRWIEAIRQKAKLTREDIAAVIGMELAYVEQVESGDLAPQTLPCNELGALVQLFRLHVDAVRDLLLISIAVGRARANLGVAGRLAPGKEARKTAEAMKLALDTYLADTVEISADVESEVEDCMAAVRGYLEARQARELLD